jgi:hypothetical protein
MSWVFNQFLKAPKTVMIKESQKQYARINPRNSHQMGRETAAQVGDRCISCCLYYVTPLSDVHHHFDLVLIYLEVHRFSL